MSLNPEDIARLSDAEAKRLARLYMEAEREVLLQIDRAMARGNDLRYLRGMLENIQAILEDLLTGNRQWCEQAIPRVYVAGANYGSDMAGKAVAGFGAIHQQAVKVLADNAFDRLESVRQVIGRRSEDLYRQYALEATRQSVIGYKSWQQVSRDFRDRLQVEGITGFRDARGREWNMKTYAEMVARTTTMEAHLQGTANRLLELDQDLVMVSTHVGTCEKCAPYQGKVLSLTGRDRNNSKCFATLDEARTAGLFHPNCRHAYGLYLPELEDSSDGQAESHLERGGKLQYPGGPGSRVNPEVIRNKYPVDAVLQTIRDADWASRKAFAQEHEKHGRDWAKDNGLELSLTQFDEMQRTLLQEPSGGIYYYVHGTGTEQISVFVERLRFLDRVFDRVGLVYNIAKDVRVGFWRIDKGRDYFARHSGFVEIRAAKGR